MKNKTCCFTGQGALPDGQGRFILELLKKELISLIESGITYFYTGGEFGFDMMAARAVLKLRREYKQIELIVVLPCEDRARVHELSYIKILQDADKVIYTPKRCFPGRVSERDRYLVNYSAVCICYLERASGSTAYTVNYAKKKGLTIKNLAE